MTHLNGSCTLAIAEEHGRTAFPDAYNLISHPSMYRIESGKLGRRRHDLISVDVVQIASESTTHGISPIFAYTNGSEAKFYRGELNAPRDLLEEPLSLECWLHKIDFISLLKHVNIPFAARRPGLSRETKRHAVLSTLHLVNFAFLLTGRIDYSAGITIQEFADVCSRIQQITTAQEKTTIPSISSNAMTRKSNVSQTLASEDAATLPSQDNASNDDDGQVVRSTTKRTIGMLRQPSSADPQRNLKRSKFFRNISTRLLKLAEILDSELNQENKNLNDRVAELEAELATQNDVVLQIKRDLEGEKAKRRAAEKDLKECVDKNAEITERYNMFEGKGQLLDEGSLKGGGG